MTAIEAEEPPARPWWGYLGWFWSAGSWLSVLGALGSWVLSAVSAVFGVLVVMATVTITANMSMPYTRNFVDAIGMFILAFFALLLVLVVIAAAMVLAVAFVAAAALFHGVGILTSAATIVSPSAPLPARLSGVPPLLAHVGGMSIIVVSTVAIGVSIWWTDRQHAQQQAAAAIVAPPPVQLPTEWHTLGVSADGGQIISASATVITVEYPPGDMKERVEKFMAPIEAKGWTRQYLSDDGAMATLVKGDDTIAISALGMGDVLLSASRQNDPDPAK